MGEDGAAWNRVFGSSSAHYGALLDDLLVPILHVPRHPFRLARFGIPAAAPATVLASVWKTPQARALFGGVAAHSFSPLNRLMSSAVGCALIDAGHAFGWPVAKGGSGAITDALASVLRESGGHIETERRVTSFAELEGAEVVAFDLAPVARRGDHGRAPSGPGRSCVPPLPPRPRVRSSSTWQSRGVCRGRTRPAGRQGQCT